jgi:hypothetical protein
MLMREQELMTWVVCCWRREDMSGEMKNLLRKMRMLLVSGDLFVALNGMGCTREGLGLGYGLMKEGCYCHG